VIAVAGAIPKVLAIFGLAWLLAAVFVGRTRGERLRRGTAAGVLLVAAEIAIEILGSVAANYFPLAFALCIFVGAAGLVLLLLWLLRADIHRWTAD
jgi:predicted MFS family arabinose efflux permease